MIKNEFSLNNSIIIYITKRSTPHNTKDIHRQMKTLSDTLSALIFRHKIYESNKKQQCLPST